MYVDEIAQVCHGANRVLQALQPDSGVPVSPAWEDETQETRDGAVEGVIAGHTPEQSHRQWCATKIAHGWTRGEVKDPDARTHPNLVPYSELPADQRVKDELFGAIVRALAPRPRPLWYGRQHSIRVSGPRRQRRVVLDDEYELRGVRHVLVDEDADGPQTVTVELLTPAATVEAPEAAA